MTQHGGKHKFPWRWQAVKVQRQVTYCTSLGLKCFQLSTRGDAEFRARGKMTTHIQSKSSTSLTLVGGRIKGRGGGRVCMVNFKLLGQILPATDWYMVSFFLSIPLYLSPQPQQDMYMNRNIIAASSLEASYAPDSSPPYILGLHLMKR